MGHPVGPAPVVLTRRATARTICPSRIPIPVQVQFFTECLVTGENLATLLKLSRTTAE